MYSSESDSDSSDDAPLVIHVAASPVSATSPPSLPAQVTTTTTAGRAAAAVDTVAESADLSEEYLERCAVLVDFMPLFPNDGAVPAEDNPVVEGYVRLVRYPFCGRDALAFGDRSLVYAPHVDCRGMARNAKSARVALLDRFASNKHGVAPKLVGADAPGKWRDFDVVMRQAAAKEATSRTNVCLAAENSEGATKKLRDSLTTVLEQATQCCRQERVSAAVAFLTPESRKADVQLALDWFQLVCGVQFPPYRIFTLASVAGPKWETLLRPRFDGVSLSRSCPLHSRTILNGFGNPFHCCVGTVLDLYRVVVQAGLLVEEAAENEKCQRAPSPHGPAIELE